MTEREEGAQVIVTTTHVCNAARDERCWLCAETKAADAPLAWPIYQEALRKEEIRRGTIAST